MKKFHEIKKFMRINIVQDSSLFLFFLSLLSFIQKCVIIGLAKYWSLKLRNRVLFYSKSIQNLLCKEVKLDLLQFILTDPNVLNELKIWSRSW